MRKKKQEIDPRPAPAVIMAGDEYLSFRTVAAICGVSENHLANLTARGVLPYVTIGRCRRIKKSDLYRFLQANTKGGWAAKDDPGDAA